MKKIAECCRVWTDDKIRCLLAIWSKDAIQCELNGFYRKDPMRQKIAQELKWQNGSFNCSSTQCSTKVKQLKKQYKDEVDNLHKSGVGLESDDVPLFREKKNHDLVPVPWHPFSVATFKLLTQNTFFKFLDKGHMCVVASQQQFFLQTRNTYFTKIWRLFCSASHPCKTLCIIESGIDLPFTCITWGTASLPRRWDKAVEVH